MVVAAGLWGRASAESLRTFAMKLSSVCGGRIALRHGGLSRRRRDGDRRRSMHGPPSDNQ